MSRVNAHHSSRVGRRIVVVGTTGSGKSTLAGRLSRLLGCPHIEFDALYWDPEWTAAPIEVFRERVSAALEPDDWVADGNYGTVRDIVWPRADTVVWLDYPLRTVLWRLSRRTLARVITKEELWNGNRERLVHQFQRDSILLWAVQTHGRRRRELNDRLIDPQYAHLHVVHLRSPSETQAWLTRLETQDPQLGLAIPPPSPESRPTQ